MATCDLRINVAGRTYVSDFRTEKTNHNTYRFFEIITIIIIITKRTNDRDNKITKFLKKRLGEKSGNGTVA